MPILVWYISSWFFSFRFSGLQQFPWEHQAYSLAPSGALSRGAQGEGDGNNGARVGAAIDGFFVFDHGSQLILRVILDTIAVGGLLVHSENLFLGCCD